MVVENILGQPVNVRVDEQPAIVFSKIVFLIILDEFPWRVVACLRQPLLETTPDPFWCITVGFGRGHRLN